MKIVDLSPQQLRRFIQGQPEKDYLLIDVRQPGEYQWGHITGARLMPLPELVRAMETLPRDKALVFYCHSGGRSMAAAAMVADYPRVQLFSDAQTPARIFETAINLEKGALNFYTRVHSRYADQPWAKVFADLAQAEIGHAKTVYRFLRQTQHQVTDFETLFDRIAGDVLEGGTPLEQAL